MKGFLQVLISACMLVPALAWSQQGSIELKSVTEVEVVTTNAKGEREVKRIEAAAAKVTPGDTVIITTTYRNTGKKPAANVTITNPVPQHTEYVDKTAEGAGSRIEFSVDRGKTYGAPDKLTVKDAKGKVRKAAPADYTDIRWMLGEQLKPGGAGSVSFRARIK